jgi:hypothetical protein
MENAIDIVCVVCSENLGRTVYPAGLAVVSCCTRCLESQPEKLILAISTINDPMVAVHVVDPARTTDMRDRN